MSDEPLKVIRETIDRDGHVVCVCGQLFLKAEDFVAHRDRCPHVARARQCGS